MNLDETLNRSLDEESEEPHCAPDGVADIDRENWNDPFQVANYAMDIFNYLKTREVRYREYITHHHLHILLP